VRRIVDARHVRRTFARPSEITIGGWSSSVLPALKGAVDNGADWVYLGLREGLRYAHARGRKVVLAVNTYPQAATWGR
jgi:collagenase-like PrtC family protease